MRCCWMNPARRNSINVMLLPAGALSRTCALSAAPGPLKYMYLDPNYSY